MQLYFTARQFCMMGRVWEVKAYCQELDAIAQSGISLRDFLQKQLH